MIAGQHPATHASFMSELPDCLYCRQDQRLHDLMIEIAPLSASTLYLFKEQSHPGRCVVAYNGHVNELFELPDAELIRYTQDVARAARAIKAAVNAKKINYGAYSDKLPHLHMHLVPKFGSSLIPVGKGKIRGKVAG